MGRPFLWLGRGMLDLLLPPACVICASALNQSETLLCPVCSEQLENAWLGRHVSGPEHFEHLPVKPAMSWVLYGWQYARPVAALIKQLKYHGHEETVKQLAVPLSRILAVTELPLHVQLVPVPLHAVRKRERGYNQSERLARALGQLLNLPVNCYLLKRDHYTATQTHLDASGRFSNVGQAFSVRRQAIVQGGAFLLVDDVVTTGATMHHCAELLKSSGCQWVAGVAVSRPDDLWQDRFLSPERN